MDHSQIARGRVSLLLDESGDFPSRVALWLKDWIKTLSMVADRVAKLRRARMLKSHICLVCFDSLVL